MLFSHIIHLKCETLSNLLKNCYELFEYNIKSSTICVILKKYIKIPLFYYFLYTILSFNGGQHDQRSSQGATPSIKSSRYCSKEYLRSNQVTQQRGAKVNRCQSFKLYLQVQGIRKESKLSN
jgi:hypothetical protein